MKIRNTVQKRLIREAVDTLRHPTAGEVYQQISKIHANISKGTIYRNLKKMVRDGEIGLIPLAGDAERYDANPIWHSHLSCQKCGEIFDFGLPSTYMTTMRDRLNHIGGFVVESAELIFYGLCPDCAGGGGEPAEEEQLHVTSRLPDFQ